MTTSHASLSASLASCFPEVGQAPASSQALIMCHDVNKPSIKREGVKSRAKVVLLSCKKKIINK